MGYNRFGQDTDNSLPVGATVPTVITTDDPAKPNWLNLSLPNTLVDITTYPSFATVTQSNLSATFTPVGNLASFLTSTWAATPFTYATYLNGKYWTVKDDNTANYARIWNSNDGITWTECANLTHDGSSYSRPEQIRMKYLSDGYVYVVATTGIYRSNNNGTNWVHTLNPPSNYWGDIAYDGVTYVITGGSVVGGIVTTTDFVTFTNRYSVPYQHTSSSQIHYSATFSKFFVHSANNDGGGLSTHKVSSSYDGISGWSDSTVVAGSSSASANTGLQIAEFGGGLVLFLGSSISINYKSLDGTTWTTLANVNALLQSHSYGESALSTPDALYYQNSPSTLCYINSLTSPNARNVTGLGNTTLGCLKYDTVNNYIFSSEHNSNTSLALRRLPYLTTSNKVVMPVQNTLVRVY